MAPGERLERKVLLLPQHRVLVGGKEGFLREANRL